MVRVSVAVSHPIQHFCPLYAFLSRSPSLEVEVLFGVRGGASGYFDAGFQRRVEFGNLYLDDFPHVFLTDEGETTAEHRVTASQVWRELRRFQPDVVVVYGSRRPTARAAWMWAVAHHRRIAYVSDSEDRGVQGSRRLSSSRIVAPLAFKTMDTFLSVGDANEEYYLRRGVPAHKFRRTPFPIDLGMMDRALARSELRGEARDRIELSGSDILVLNVGKLAAGKRQEDLVRAAAIVDTPLILALVGSGPLENDLRQLAQSLDVRLETPGFVDPNVLPEWYAAADIYVHPSRNDHHPLAVSEAVYAGLPVVVTHTTGSHGRTDDVRPWQNGLVARTGDPVSLAVQITRIAEDPSLRRRFAARSREIGRSQQELAYAGLETTLQELS